MEIIPVGVGGAFATTLFQTNYLVRPHRGASFMVDFGSTAPRALAHWGIEALVEEGRRTWSERAGVGDLAALRARSRAVEAEALTDPTGLGAFRVLEWQA